MRSPYRRIERLLLGLACALAPARALAAQIDLGLYLATAGHYATIDRAAAVREARTWSQVEVTRALGALQHRQDRLRSVVTAPEDIDFRIVEAAVLLHADTGLLSLQEGAVRAAKFHLETAAELRKWSSRAAVQSRNRAEIRRYAFKGGVPLVGLSLKESIDGRDLYVGISAAALALGYNEIALRFAERAREWPPTEPEVCLLVGSVAAAYASEKALQRDDSEVRRARASAEKAFREAIVSDTKQEAHLRLGKLLLDEDRASEAEPLLAEADAKALDDRVRYLARLFRGRAAERQDRLEDAIAAYRGALEAWPDSQPARLALAHALGKSSGPAASRELVAAALDVARRPDRDPDPWSLYPAGPPGLAQAVLQRLRSRTLGR